MFWLFRLNEIDLVKNEMVALRACGLESLMALFTWQEDKAGDWTQWIVTLVENNLTGDCDLDTFIQEQSKIKALKEALP